MAISKHGPITHPLKPDPHHVHRPRGHVAPAAPPMQDSPAEEAAEGPNDNSAEEQAEGGAY